MRIGWVGGTSGKRLRDYRWSSFIYYGGRKAPEWMVTERVLGRFELDEGRRGLAAYARYLEQRAKDKEGSLTDESLKELRRGWYLGEEAFGKKLLGRLSGKVKKGWSKGSLRGEAARSHDESEAERLVKVGLKALGLPPRRALEGRGKQLDAKALLAALIRERSRMENGWVALRLSMGSESSVTRAVRRVREEKRLQAKYRELKQMPELRD